MIGAQSAVGSNLSRNVPELQDTIVAANICT
jgi:hypothetical protein